MRRILFPLLIIGMAAGLFTLGSGAFFSDFDTDTGNTITAGTLTVGINPFFADNCDLDEIVKPGDSDTCNSTVTNTGSITGKLYMRVVVTSPDSLAGQLQVSSGSTAASTGTVLGPANTWVAGTFWSDLALSCTQVATLDANETFAFSFLTTFNTAAGNAFQGKSATLDFYYALIQEEDPTPPANCVAP